MSYFDDARRSEGYTVCEPQGPPLCTVDDDGSIVMEWETSKLAIKLSSEVADGLAAAIAKARATEAELEVDDAGLWPDRP